MAEGPSFKPMIQHEWYNIDGTPLHLKLKGLQFPIKVRNRQHFGCIDQKLKNLEKENDLLDSLVDHTSLIEMQWRRKKALESSLIQWRNKKSQLLRQYLRVRNITEKDEITEFFMHLRVIE